MLVVTTSYSKCTWIGPRVPQTPAELGTPAIPILQMRTLSKGERRPKGTKPVGAGLKPGSRAPHLSISAGRPLPSREKGTH